MIGTKISLHFLLYRRPLEANKALASTKKPDVDDDDSDDDEPPAKKPATTKPTAPVTKPAPAPVGAAKKPVVPAKKPVEEEEDSDDSDDSDDDDEDDDVEEEDKPVVKKPVTATKAPATPAAPTSSKKPAAATPAPSSSGSNGSNEDGQVHKIYVKGLPWKVTEKELNDFFKPCGKINSVEIPVDAYGRSSGTAYVKFSARNELDKALELDGQFWHGTGRCLKIQRSIEKPKGVANGPRPEGCDTVFVGKF